MKGLSRKFEGIDGLQIKVYMVKTLLTCLSKELANLEKKTEVLGVGHAALDLELEKLAMCGDSHSSSSIKREGTTSDSR